MFLINIQFVTWNTTLWLHDYDKYHTDEWINAWAMPWLHVDNRLYTKGTELPYNVPAGL